MNETIAITGCSGFIGNELAKYFLLKGKNVIGLNRSIIKIDEEKFIYVKYELKDAFNFSILKNVSTIIHCAYMQWSPSNKNADEININATLALSSFCEKNNKKLVFLSSFSAHEKATSHYGKHKFELENILKQKHLVIKPGLVIGNKGMYFNLSKIITDKKFIPIIGNGKQPLQWLRINELCKGIENGIEKNLIGVFPFASEKSISFLNLNRLIASRVRKSPYFIFIPVTIAEILLKIIGQKLPFTKENLDGLSQLIEFDTLESQQQLEVTVSPI
jgi:nucleoside-diphosphate-sugar epimerase